MKRFTKKYLMLLAVIVALMTVTMFAASAACQHTDFPSYEGNVIAPTCTTEGYTEAVCGGCNEVIGRVPGSDVPAKGHQYKSTMVSNGDHYEKHFECSVCFLNTKETDGNKVVTYYAVRFLNPAATKTYDESLAYTRLAVERVGISDAEELGVAYVKAGETVQESQIAGISPICDKDFDYGDYDFDGWYYPASADADFSLEDLIKPAPPAETFSAGLVEYDPLGGEPVNSNLDVYASFQGRDVSYSVRFYDYNGRALAVAQGVPHGKAAVYNLDIPTKDSDVKFRYKFNYWSYEGKEVILSAIYDDVAVRADYVSIPREYNISYYYDSSCTEPIINKEIAVKDSKVKYGEPATNGLAIPTDLLNKEADDQYIYAWTGKWVLANRQDFVVSLNSFSVPAGTPDALDGSAEVRLIPQYEKKLRVYDLKVTIVYPDDNNYHPEDVFVQILYANGQSADGRYATPAKDKDGNIIPNTYEFSTLVNYSTHYTIAATATGYKGETVSNFVIGPSGAIITMEKVGAYSCGCICHTFLKPLWVRILRLLHTLFGVEHVCCSDMFANIGPSLNYGPGKN